MTISLVLDGDFLPQRVSKDDTRLTSKRTVERQIGKAFLVRTKESITPESGEMSWKIAFDGTGSIRVGVVASTYEYSKDYKHPKVWVTEGDGDFGWDNDDGNKVNVTDESPEHTYRFKPGDVVEVTYNPHTQLLSVAVEGMSGWRTTRRLEGDGLARVHPCFVLTGFRSTARVLSREGLAHGEKPSVEGLAEHETTHRDEVATAEDGAWRRLAGLHAGQIRILRRRAEGLAVGSGVKREKVNFNVLFDDIPPPPPREEAPEFYA